MITERKLRSLQTTTRLRKAGRMLLSAEQRMGKDAGDGDGLGREKLLLVFRVLSDGQDVPPLVRDIARDRLSGLREASVPAAVRAANDLRHALWRELGIASADWDLLPRENEGGAARIAPIRLFLEDIRSPFNVGAIFRTAECFGVQSLLLSPDTASPTHPRARRTAMGTIDVVPWRVVAAPELACEPALFALELGGAPVDTFAFPRSGTMVVGTEELGVSPDLQRRARDGAGVVTVPLYGGKASLNVSVAVGIALHRWRSCIDVPRIDEADVPPRDE